MKIIESFIDFDVTKRIFNSNFVFEELSIN